MQTLYAASYSLHLVVRKERGDAPKVMPLEALWWVDEAKQRDVLAAVALRRATMADSDRDRWRWQAMIMQPDPIDPAAVARAVEQVRRQQPPGGSGSAGWLTGRPGGPSPRGRDGRRRRRCCSRPRTIRQPPVSAGSFGPVRGRIERAV